MRGGVLHTPPESGSILNGITRDTVFALAEDRGIKVVEGRIPRESLYTADEIFLCGTAAEITPVRSVDRCPIGDGNRGPVTRTIQDAFFGLFSAATADSHGWLSGLEEPK